MPNDDRGLVERVVVVTGAAGGIGAATARRLRACGAQVVAVDADAVALARLERDTGVMSLVADVRDPAHAPRVVGEVLGVHGRIDGVVANAGIGHAGPVAGMTAERIDEVLAVNARAPMLLTRAALPSMLEAGHGAIVFVTSVAGVLLVPGESVYSASKAAVEAFAEPLREELRGSGVTVSVVRPAVVATAFFDERGEPYTRRWPRPVPPERIAAAIVEAIVRGTPEVTVPRWFVVPTRIRSMFPSVYRALARRFG